MRAQWLSFGISVTNIAHAVASVDYSFDTSSHFRNIEPLSYGYYPPGAKGDGLFASIAVFAFGYVTSKLVAVAMLGTISPASLALVLVVESLALLVARTAIGNWRFFNQAGDSAAFSLFVHFIVIFPIMIAAPFPVFRHPFGISPSVYSGFIAWSLFAANPLIVAFAFRYHEPVISQWIVWAILGSATALSMVAALIAFVLMQPTFRGTFYRHRTMGKHVRDFFWVRDTKLDGTRIAGNDDLDAVRAVVLGERAKAYWPTDLARQWVREGWENWLSKPPEWFTEEWKARVPTKEWLADGGGVDAESSATMVPRTSQESSFRRTISSNQSNHSLLLWHMSPRDLEAFLDERFVESTTLPPANEKEKTKRRQLVHQVANAGGLGFLAKCCTNLNEPPWVQISHAANGKQLLRADAARVKQLTSVLCNWGLSFYYQLYVSSGSHSPLRGYKFVNTIAKPPNSSCEMMMVRNRETEQLTTLTLMPLTTLETMAHDLSKIQKASETCKCVASLYHWGATGAVGFILGEHGEGGPLVERIKPGIGIDSDAEFWRLSYQLAQGVSEIHQHGLNRFGIRVRCPSILFQSYVFAP